MEWKEYFESVGKGVVGAIAVTIILTSILSFFMSFVDIASSLFSGLYVSITAIGLIFGTIVAAKLYGRKGWIVGLAVGVLYYIALYLIGILFGAEATLSTYELFKFIISIAIGILSGMLGINLGRE